MAEDGVPGTGGHAAGAICAMLRVTMRFDDITDQVASQLRHERAAARGKDQEPGR